MGFLDAFWFSGTRPAPRKHLGGVRLIEVGKDVLDVDGHLAQAYQPTEGEVMAIRPDRHLGLRSRQESTTKELRKRDVRRVVSREVVAQLPHPR